MATSLQGCRHSPDKAFLFALFICIFPKTWSNENWVPIESLNISPSSETDMNGRRPISKSTQCRCPLQLAQSDVNKISKYEKKNPQVAVKNSHLKNFMIHLKNSNNCWNEPFCACTRSISVCNCILWWNQIKHRAAVIWKVHLLRWKAKFYFFAHISSFFEQKVGTSKEIYNRYADGTIVCVWRGQVHYTWVSWAPFTFFTLGAITIYWQRPTWIDLHLQRPTSWHFVGFGPKKQVNATLTVCWRWSFQQLFMR